jgi:cytochrome P450
MSFRPERAADLPEGVNPFGLAFGGGSHLCFGMPIATQAAPAPAGTAMHRPMLLLLRELIRAGVRPDTSQEAPMAPSARPSLLTYPVIVPAPVRSTG